ncbi:hypothetical Protein YC6258_00845 [Gynuella sunshinyii YC6258]|uniref:Uncharacterized protein n=1 Tax=Gynuella sunshinyii YC6258 TaxID=1445510 RepID=A0A0C5V003_9GAMM|nr:hypothetical Protein YC6258_00845 [Gynuella sunshinyii YC6258]
MNSASELDEIRVGQLKEDAPVHDIQLMEKVVEAFNLRCALHKVQ